MRPKARASSTARSQKSRTNNKPPVLKPKRRPKRKVKTVAARNLLEPLSMDDNHFRYSIHERLFHEKFDRKDVSFVKELLPRDFTMEMLLKEGFTQPVFFRNAAPSGMRVPKNLTLETILKSVGAKTSVEVIDSASQDGVQMRFGRFIEYFTRQDKRALPKRTQDKMYNLIDLEVSQYSIGRQIEAPTVVRQLDWAKNVWPGDLRPPAQNDDEYLTYPKTQKYVLLSKAGCFTDFHIDFGGSSVWYHLLQGKKIFLLIPPSEKNRNIYAQWVRTGQHLAFLGDEVDECERIEVSAGDTLMIPSGWIHCVYTMDDSIVLGGNFLHSLNGDMQLDIAVLEKALKVKKSIRYPFFHDLLWFVAQRCSLSLKRHSNGMIVSPFERASLLALVKYLETTGAMDKDLCSIASQRISKPKLLLRLLKEQLELTRTPKSRNDRATLCMDLDQARDSPEIEPPVPVHSNRKRMVSKEAAPNGVRHECDSSNLPDEKSGNVCDSSTQTEFLPCACHYPPPWYYWNGPSCAVSSSQTAQVMPFSGSRFPMDWRPPLISDIPTQVPVDQPVYMQL